MSNRTLHRPAVCVGDCIKGQPFRITNPTANKHMKYFQLFCDIAEAFFPLTMFINGFTLGWFVADHFNEKANAKKLGDKKDGDGEHK